jgi:hypothetical protein
MDDRKIGTMLRIFGLALLAIVMQAISAVGQQPFPNVKGKLPVTAAVDRTTREMVFTIGPFDLPTSREAHGAMVATGALQTTIPVSGWVQGYRVEFVDGAGQRVPQKVLHHLNIIQPKRRDLFSQIMQRIGAAGEETPPVVTPAVVGYRIKAGDPLLLKGMFHNPTGQAYKGVRLLLRMPYTTEDRILHPMSIYPFYLDVMPPAGIHAFDLLPGQSTTSWEGKPALSGRILAMGGHMHKYGVALRLEDVTAKKLIWEGKPPMDKDGEPSGMPVQKYFWRLGLPIDAKHVYRLTALYDNPTGRMIPGGGMGALGGVFLPRAAAPWPSVDTRSPEYQKDIRVTIYDEGAMSGMGDMGAGMGTSTHTHTH